MSRTTVSELANLWFDDPNFRRLMAIDPEGAVRSTGLELDAEEWAALRNVDWSLVDEAGQVYSNEVDFDFGAGFV